MATFAAWFRKHRLVAWTIVFWSSDADAIYGHDGTQSRCLGVMVLAAV
ncbi:MAG: hypothetical protein MUC71_03710 [Steroidobacteraceae bacterium]|nr:hypothetical protein [Steroidobacteraceae bacterium]